MSPVAVRRKVRGRPDAGIITHSQRFTTRELATRKTTHLPELSSRHQEPKSRSGHIGLPSHGVCRLVSGRALAAARAFYGSVQDDLTSSLKAFEAENAGALLSLISIACVRVRACVGGCACVGV